MVDNLENTLLYQLKFHLLSSEVKIIIKSDQEQGFAKASNLPLSAKFHYHNH
jgi:hypothetical protein